jgi:hypothetical protein
MAKKPTKKKAVKKTKKAVPKKVVKKPLISTTGPNKEVKVLDLSGDIEVTNIIEHPVLHRGGIIPVGGKGKVTQYEADLLRRKKQVK